MGRRRKRRRRKKKGEISDPKEEEEEEGDVIKSVSLSTPPSLHLAQDIATVAQMLKCAGPTSKQDFLILESMF